MGGRRQAAASRLADRRMLLGGGAVVVALVIGVPRLSSHARAHAPTPAPTAVPGAGVGAPGTRATARAPELGQLAGDPQPAPATGQLGSFSVFRGKDPFLPPPGTVPATIAPALAPTASPGAPAAAQAPALAPAASGLAGVAPRPTLSAGPATARAVLSVDGVAETVPVGGSFPAAQPVFTLVGLTSGGAEIGIAGGSYASGASTVTLTPGAPLTLVDTRDGARYELTLLTAS